MYLNLTFHGVNATFHQYFDMYTNEIISYDLSLSPNLEQISKKILLTSLY